MARGRTSPKGVAEKQEFATRMTPASGQNASVRGVPTGWLAPTKVERGSLAVPIEVAAKVVSALVAPFIWLFSYFHDMIMFKIIDNEFIYNVSWEDPRIDQHLFKLTRDDHVLTIASAGDNALDYVIDGARVTAVEKSARRTCGASVFRSPRLTLCCPSWNQPSWMRRSS